MTTEPQRHRHSFTSVYFRDICSPIVSVPFRSRLRSADKLQRWHDCTTYSDRARYGPRSFRVAAPQIWNMLPPHLKNSNVSREQFKSGLKTWLFVQAYSHKRRLWELCLSDALEKLIWLIDWHSASRGKTYHRSLTLLIRINVKKLTSLKLPVRTTSQP